MATERLSPITGSAAFAGLAFAIRTANRKRVVVSARPDTTASYQAQNAGRLVNHVLAGL